VVERRVELWSALAEERGVRLAAGVDGGVVRASEGRVVQVLDNLLANALDAAPLGSAIMVTAAGGELHVVDEGAGLGADQRVRAFDRFWRASKNQARDSASRSPSGSSRWTAGRSNCAPLRVEASMPSSATRSAEPERHRPVPVLCSGAVATMTRMHAGFTGVVQHDWPRPRGWTPPQRLDTLDVVTLPGVGPTLAKRLRTFGIQSVRDLLFHAPRRYESASTRSRSQSSDSPTAKSRSRSNSRRSRATPAGKADARHGDRSR